MRLPTCCAHYDVICSARVQMKISSEILLSSTLTLCSLIADTTCCMSNCAALKAGQVYLRHEIADVLQP